MSIKNMYNFIKEIWKQNENIPSQCPICTVAWKRRAAILLVKHHCIVLMFRVFTALYQHQGFPQEFVNVCLPTGLKTGLHGSSHLKIVGSCWRTEFLKIAFFLSSWRDNVFVKLKMFLMDMIFDVFFFLSAGSVSYRGGGAVASQRHTLAWTPLAAVGVSSATVAVCILVAPLVISICQYCKNMIYK